MADCANWAEIFCCKSTASARLAVLHTLSESGIAIPCKRANHGAIGGKTGVFGVSLESGGGEKATCRHGGHSFDLPRRAPPPISKFRLHKVSEHENGISVAGTVYTYSMMSICAAGSILLMLRPRFFVEAVQFIEQHVCCEGLFRKAGSMARQKAMRVGCALACTPTWVEG